MRLEVNGSIVNQKDLEVLVKTVDCEDSISAVDLREQIRWLDDCSKSTYRLNKLEDAELVQTWRDNENKQYQLAPRIVQPTSLGETVVNSYNVRDNISNKDNQSTSKRIAELEEQLEIARKERDELERGIMGLEYQYDNLEDLITLIQVLLEKNGIDVTEAWYAREENDRT